MNTFARAAAVVVVVFVLGAAGYFVWLRSATAAPAPVSVSDVEIGKAYAYHDFHSCTLPDGTRAFDLHFGGRDRSLRAQLVSREDNMGRPVLQIVTTDRTLPKGFVRFVTGSVAARTVEGHSAGTAWSTEVLQINPRRPFERQRVIGPCGPSR